MNNVEELQLQLLKAISHHFSDDATRPGIVVSFLRNEQIYASIVRYNNHYVNGKQIIVKAQAKNLKDALIALSIDFLKFIDAKQSPIDTLKATVAKEMPYFRNTNSFYDENISKF